MKKIPLLALVSFLISSAVQSMESCGTCNLDLQHQHESSWMRLYSEANNTSILIQEQKQKDFNFSGLLINLYDFLNPINKATVTLTCKNIDGILSCFESKNNNNEKKINDIVFIIKEKFPYVGFISYGLYDPKDKKQFITSVTLERSEEIENIKEAFAHQNILIDDNVRFDRSLDAPASEYFLESINPHQNKWARKLECAINSLPAGASVGVATWMVLAVKDQVFGVVLAGGAELYAFSFVGFTLPVLSGVAVAAITAATFDLDLKKFLNVLRQDVH